MKYTVVLRIVQEKYTFKDNKCMLQKYYINVHVQKLYMFILFSYSFQIY